MNYMVHNLTPGRAKVYITYDLDFLPASAPAAIHPFMRGSFRVVAR